ELTASKLVDNSWHHVVDQLWHDAVEHSGHSLVLGPRDPTIHSGLYQVERLVAAGRHSHVSPAADVTGKAGDPIAQLACARQVADHSGPKAGQSNGTAGPPSLCHDARLRSGTLNQTDGGGERLVGSLAYPQLFCGERGEAHSQARQSRAGVHLLGRLLD